MKHMCVKNGPCARRATACARRSPTARAQTRTELCYLVDIGSCDCVDVCGIDFDDCFTVDVCVLDV